MSDARVAQTPLPLAAPALASSFAATAGLWVACLTGLAVVTMGLAALAGWILGQPALVQWQPWLPPLFHATALALALAGAAQLLLASGSRTLSLVLASTVVVLATAALAWPGVEGLNAPVRTGSASWIGGWVERLLVTTTVRDAQPMTMPAAVGLLLAGGSLLIHAKRRQSLFCLNVARLLGVAVTLVGLTGLASRAMGGSVPAAIGAIGLLPQAAIALSLLGIGLVAMPLRVAAIAGPGGAACLAPIAGVACLLVTLTLWQTAQRRQDAQITGALRESAASAQARTVVQFEHDRRQLAYVGRQMALLSEDWPRTGPQSWPPSGLEGWLRASEPYLTGQPSHRAMLWVDEQLRVAGVNGADDLMLHGVDLGADAARGAALRDAMALGDEAEEVVLRADDLLRGRPTLLIAEPIHADDGHAGFAAGLVDLDTMFRMILHDEEARGFAFEVSDGARAIYRTAAALDTPSHQHSLLLSSVGFTLRVTPSPRLLARNLGPVSDWALGFGLLATVLLTATIYAAQVARRRWAAQERLNAALNEQIAHRHEAERELQQATSDLQQSHLELKQATADLQQTNRELEQTTTELQQSNRELEQFAAVASHDLRAPLQKVRSFADLLEQDQESRLGDEGRDFLQRLKRSITRMEWLVDDLLTLARVRANGRPFTQVDLAVIVREVLSDLDATLRETGGRVDVGELPAIDADPTQMHQLIQNLLGNGLKFRRAEEPPVVRISARLVENGASAAAVHGPTCQLRVSDNGIGFDDRHADRIFKPFERLHGPQQYEGSGIGLAVCARIAERHGGTIAAASTPGQGAVFTVTLPVYHVKIKDPLLPVSSA